jgi:hypothetical protein
MLLTPQIKEPAVAEREVLGRIHAKALRGAIDPLGQALELGVIADRGFVNDAAAFAVMPLGAPLFITEGRDETEREKYAGQGVAVGNRSFSLDAVLVAAFAGRRRRQPFVRQRPPACVAANAQNLSTRAHLAVGSVIEHVALKAARSFNAKAGGLEALCKTPKVSDAEFDLSFDRHGTEYKRRRRCPLPQVRIEM